MWLRAGQWIGGQCFTGFGGNDWGYTSSPCVVTSNASVKLGHGGHVVAYVSAREKKAHARTHIGPDVEVERAQYVLVPQDALRPAKLGRRGRLERA